MLLDIYQYQLCEMMQVQDITPEERNRLASIRITIVMQLNRFVNILSSILLEPNSERSEILLRDTILSTISFTENLINSKEFVLSPIHDSDKIGTHTPDELTRTAQSVNQDYKPLKTIFPDIDKKKDYIAGSVEVVFTPEFKKQYKKNNIQLINDIKNISGVIDVLFTDGGTFDLLVNIEVNNSEEAKYIEEKIERVRGVDQASVYLSTLGGNA